MSTEAEELHRIISASVRDMLDAYRIQAAAGPVTDKAPEEIVFRAAHGVLQSLAPYPRKQRVALLPSVAPPAGRASSPSCSPVCSPSLRRPFHVGRLGVGV